VSTKGAQGLAFSHLGLSGRPIRGSWAQRRVCSCGFQNLTLTTTTNLAGHPGHCNGRGNTALPRARSGAVKRVRLRSEIGVAAPGALNDRIDARTALMDSWADFDGAAGAEIDVLF